MNFHRHPAQLHPHGVRAEVPVPVTVKPQARVTRVRMPVREAASVPDEGGQMPLYRRLPKRGFKNCFAKEYTTVNISALERFEDGAVVDLDLLVNAGLAHKAADGLKVLGNGNVDKKFTVRAAAFTAAAKEKIEAAGGKCEVV